MPDVISDTNGKLCVGSYHMWRLLSSPDNYSLEHVLLSSVKEWCKVRCYESKNFAIKRFRNTNKCIARNVNAATLALNPAENHWRFTSTGNLL